MAEYKNRQSYLYQFFTAFLIQFLPATPSPQNRFYFLLPPASRLLAEGTSTLNSLGAHDWWPHTYPHSCHPVNISPAGKLAKIALAPQLKLSTDMVQVCHKRDAQIVLYRLQRSCCAHDATTSCLQLPNLFKIQLKTWHVKLTLRKHASKIQIVQRSITRLWVRRAIVNMSFNGSWDIPEIILRFRQHRNC